VLEYGLSAAEVREEQRMEYARLGDTGLMVSELCLGCMTFGREADEETSTRCIPDTHRATRMRFRSGLVSEETRLELTLA
jgi:hypothetical protein